MFHPDNYASYIPIWRCSIQVFLSTSYPHSGNELITTECAHRKDHDKYNNNVKFNNQYSPQVQ